MKPILIFRPLVGGLLLCTAMIITAGTVALAKDGGLSPRISGSLAIEAQNDLAYASDDSSEEFNTLFVKIEPAFTLTLTDRLSVNAGLILQPVR
jgi:hypothetical protein